jgi:hypothetical protein
MGKGEAHQALGFQVVIQGREGERVEVNRTKKNTKRERVMQGCPVRPGQQPGGSADSCSVLTGKSYSCPQSWERALLPPPHVPKGVRRASEASRIKDTSPNLPPQSVHT